MKNNEIHFVKTNFENLEEIENTEKEIFKDYSRVFNKQFLEKWYFHNKDMFYTVKDNDKKVEFTILTTVTHKFIIKSYQKK